MNDKIFEKDVTYRAKVRVKAGTDEIIVVEKGDSEMYTTTGKRNPKRVIQLMVPESTGDMVGEMKRQFDAFILEMGGTPSPDPMDRPLQTQEVKKTVNLLETPDYGTEISNLEGELRRCLLINRTSVLNACRAR